MMQRPAGIGTGERLRMGHLPELDGLRGVAIFLVVLYHYGYGSFKTGDPRPLGAWVHSVFSLSWSGVDLFFVLSGFLIGGILMDHREARNYFAAFYIRRICRIFPLYFLWLGLFFILCGIWHYGHQNRLGILLNEQGIPPWSYFAFMQNVHVAISGLFGSAWLGVTWSLAVEEQFYLVMPCIIWLTPIRKLPYLLMAMILGIPILRVYLQLYHTGIFQYVLLPCRADALLLGVFCAYLIRNATARRWFEKQPSRLLEILLVLSLGMICLTVIAKGRGVYYITSQFEMLSLGYTWMAAFYACLLLIAITAQDGIIVRIMRWEWLRKLGVIAYGVYLIHIAVNVGIHKFLGKQDEPLVNNPFEAFLTLAALVITILLAKLSWHCFEKPIINWGHAFSYADTDVRAA